MRGTDRQARPTQTCPACQVPIVRAHDDPPLDLPGECPNCLIVARERARDAENIEAQQAMDPTQGDVLAIKRNLGALQRDVSVLTAKVAALAGDLSDLRRGQPVSEVPAKRRRSA